MFVHAKLSVDRIVTVGPNLHHLIYNFLITIVFPHIFGYQLTLKYISQGYAQQKGFSRFNWISPSRLKVSKYKTAITRIIRDISAESDFTF